MEYVEKWGNTEDEAIELALADLKISKEEASIEILEESSKGFLGIGKKLAKVRVSRKSAFNEKIVDKTDVKLAETTLKEDKVENMKPKKVDKKEGKKKPSKKEDFVMPIKDLNLQPLEETPAMDFIREVVEKMGIDVQISAMCSKEGDVYIDIEGKDAACVIGKRGQTLDALQYLTRIAVNKGDKEYTNIIVDAGKYRAKREKTLVLLARRFADKAVRTKRPMKLEPMTAYDRRIIHSALHDHKKVTTRSEGKEPYRRVIIEIQ